MKRSIKICVYTCTAFLFLLALVPYFGLIGDWARILAYVLAFAIPAATVLLVSRKFGFQSEKLPLGLGRGETKLLLPLILPCVGAVVLLSFLTSSLLALFGASSEVGLPSSGLLIALEYVIIPVLGEEFLFRYIPLRFIGVYSKRAALLVSAILFSLVHLNLFQIPYAFLAGLIFAALDLMLGSLLPSLILHTVNNVLAVLWLLFAEEYFVFPILIILGALMLISLVAVIFMHKRYYRRLSPVISHGVIHLSSEIVIFAIFATAFSVLAIL